MHLTFCPDGAVQLDWPAEERWISNEIRNWCRVNRLRYVYRRGSDHGIIHLKTKEDDDKLYDLIHYLAVKTEERRTQCFT